jgi:hypothetical protein
MSDPILNSRKLAKFILLGALVLAASFPAGTPEALGQSYGLRYSRDGQCVLVPDSDSLDVTGPYTIEAWVKAEPGVEEKYHDFIVSKNWYETGYSIGTGGTSTGYYWFHVVHSTSPRLIGQWVHVAGVWSEGVTRIYLNGHLDAAESDATVPTANDQPLWIGSSPFGADTNWRGVIDEVRIWAVARTQDQIRYDMDNCLKGDEAGLRAYWSFDEGRGQVLGDATGQNPGRLGDSDMEDNNDPEWVSGIELPLSQTWYVDGSVVESGDGRSWETAFKTIQEGIDAASHYNTVMVAEWVYDENIQFYGKNIVLRSTDPDDPIVRENTIIDGGKRESVVRFQGDEQESCVMEGFTIRNGSAVKGGAIYGQGTHATIRKNIVTGNEAEGGGGLRSCYGEIHHNIIINNTADTGGGLIHCSGLVHDNEIRDNEARYGGGLCYCGGIIEGNEIVGNDASGAGGALAECSGTIQANTILGNTAVQYGGGLQACHGVIQHNRIVGNSADDAGGGLCACHGTIQNNLVVSNSTRGIGGGLESCDGTIQDCTIVSNYAVNDGGGLYSCNGSIRNCIIWENSAGHAGEQLYSSGCPSFSCIENWDGNGIGNTGEDPLFVAAGKGDCHLKDASPCINRGVNYYWFAWPQRDLDGNCRLAGGRVDIGCYEYGSSLDSDGDLLSDEDETMAGTDPSLQDTDGDGLRDGLEVLRGSGPTASTPPEILQVPLASFPTIQAALCLALEGEEITVAAGTYTEVLRFCGASVNLRSLDPLDPGVVAETKIDASGCGPVVWFTGSETAACRISGFTLTNGATQDGGGVRGNDAHAAIENNTISNNRAAGQGGGLWKCAGDIMNNTISGNSAVWGGGGLFGCDGLIVRNVISGNWADSAQGGGLFYCNGLIARNIISQNSAASYGGGLYMCDGTIRNNLIAENRTDGDGAALYDCDYEIENNTITGNWAKYAGVLAYCDWIIRNNIIWGNVAAGGVQVYESRTPTYCCIEGWDGGGEGNTWDDPLFVDPDGADDDPQTFEDNDYHFQAESPCIDAGQNQDWMWDAVDLDVNLRILNGIVDMGAYEYVPPRTWYVDGSVVESGSGESWEAAFKTIQEGINAASDADTVIVARGTYLENISFKGKSITVRSTDPLASTVVQSTIIDGNEGGPVVTFSGTEDETCVLSGFTIRKGRAYIGGGILGGSADAHTRGTIAHNVITENAAYRGGGLIFCDGKIRNNVVSWNSAAAEGGGLYDCEGQIENNTICFNSAANEGGGLHTCAGTILNSIIWGNSAPGGAQLYGCSIPSYSCIQDWTGGGEGNISENPHFVDEAARDYHLRSWSPCVEAGSPLSGSPSKTRPIAPGTNMGAYGNTPEATSPSPDVDEDLLPDDWENHFFSSLARGPADDPDDDGVPNIDELHLATDPTSILPPNGALTVLVYNLNDPPGCPPGTTITISPTVGTINQAAYSNFLPADSYAISVSAPNFSSGGKNINVSFQSPAAAVFFLVPDPGSVSGMLLDALSVAAILEAGVQLEAISGVYTGMTFDTSTALDGLFSLTDLPAAIDYRITVVRTSYDDYQATFTLNAGEEKDLGTISLERSIRIIGNELGEFTITWTSTAGMLYNVYCRDSLLEEWSLLASGIPASGDGETSWTDNPASEVKMRFYRVEGYPGP